MTDPARKTHGSKGRPPANLLSGIALCDTCEEPVTGGTVGRTRLVEGKRVSTGRVPVYKCPNNHLSANREEVDAVVVWAFGMSVKFDNQTAQLMPLNRQGADAASLTVEAQRLTEDIKALATSYAQRRITLEQLEIATVSLQERLASVEAEIAAVVEEGASSAFDLINQNMHRWFDLDTDTRRRMLDGVARIRLYPKGRGRKGVPAKHQVTMDLVTYWQDGTERIVPALRERPADLPAGQHDAIKARSRAASAPPVSGLR